MANNQISLYKKIDNELLKRAEFEMFDLRITYKHLTETKEIDLSKIENEVVYINELDSYWDPTNHNLNINFYYQIPNKEVFFGRNSITNDHNKIGLAAKIYSKGSNFQKVHKIIEFSKYDYPILSKEYNIEFNQSTLRDSLNIELFFYLAEVNETQFGQAKEVGMILNEVPVYLLSIFVDGDGALFPITEFSDPKGPFWKLEKSWVSPEEDTFDSSNIRLAINIEHELFEQVNSGRLKTSQKLMNDIITQAMSMIIQDVLIVQNANLSEAEDSVENSILRIVKYWVETFDIETDSIFSITNSLNRNIEQAMRGVDK